MNSAGCSFFHLLNGIAITPFGGMESPLVLSVARKYKDENMLHRGSCSYQVGGYPGHEFSMDLKNAGMGNFQLYYKELKNRQWFKN